MPNSLITNFQFPFLREFSETEVQLAEKALLSREQHQCNLNETRKQKADSVIEDCNSQFHNLLGSKNHKMLRNAMQREKISYRDLLQPPVEQNHDYKKLNQVRKQKIDTLVREFGVTSEQLSAIGKGSVDKIQQILSREDGKLYPGYSMSNNLKKWNALSPLHKFPLDWGGVNVEDNPSDTHRWFLFTPPFFGFLFNFSHQASSNFIVDRLLYLNPATSLTGNKTTMDCNNADDFDYASATADSQIAFAFVPPVTGVVEVLINAQNTYNNHNLSMGDEWGWSNSNTSQINYLMMNVLHPDVVEPSLAQMSLFQATFDGDDSYHNQEDLILGGHYFAQLFSSGPVPGGQSVIVTIGTRNFDKSFSNDVTVHSKSNFQWFINSVEVRIAP
jgi:hypothetical protein